MKASFTYWPPNIKINDLQKSHKQIVTTYSATVSIQSKNNFSRPYFTNFHKFNQYSIALKNIFQGENPWLIFVHQFKISSETKSCSKLASTEPCYEIKVVDFFTFLNVPSNLKTFLFILCFHLSSTNHGAYWRLFLRCSTKISIIFTAFRPKLY